MIDWVLHIWTKPLAGWTLLDVVGLVALFFGTVFLLFLAWAFVFVIAAEFRELNKKRAETMDQIRKRLGYDQPPSPPKDDF